MEDGDVSGKMFYLKRTIPFAMKKYLLVAGITLFTTAAVMATVLTNNKKTTKNTSECCMQKKACSRAVKTACY